MPLLIIPAFESLVIRPSNSIAILSVIIHLGKIFFLAFKSALICLILPLHSSYMFRKLTSRKIILKIIKNANQRILSPISYLRLMGAITHRETFTWDCRAICELLYRQFLPRNPIPSLSSLSITGFSAIIMRLIFTGLMHLMVISTALDFVNLSIILFRLRTMPASWTICVISSTALAPLISILSLTWRFFLFVRLTSILPFMKWIWLIMKSPLIAAFIFHLRLKHFCPCVLGGSYSFEIIRLFISHREFMHTSAMQYCRRQ